MASDPQAQYDAVADEITGTSPAIRGQMFGMPCLKHEGKAFAGFHHGAMVFKLNTPAHGEALALPGAQLFDPSHQGRPMKEWVEVPAAHAERWLAFGQAAQRYVIAATRAGK